MSGISIGELVGTLSLEDKFSGPMNDVASGLGVSSQSFSAVAQFAGLAASAIVGTTAAIIALGDRGANVADVSGRFDELTSSVQSTAGEMLGTLQSATANTISNFDLMKMGSAAMNAGLVKNKEDMGTLAAGARLLADRVGGSTVEAFETLTKSMITGRETGARQLGLFGDLKGALERYAAAHGTTVSALSESEKRSIGAAAAMEELRKQLAQSGPVADDFSDNLAQAKTGVQNFTDNLGVAIATSPVIRAGMESIGTSLQQAFGGSQEATVKTLMGAVNSFAIFLVQTGSVAVSVAEFITNAFQGTKILFNLVLESLFSGISAVAVAFADLTSKAAGIPGIGEQFKALSDSFRTTADFASSMAIGFGSMKDKGLESAEATTIGFARVQEALTKAQEAMEGARGTTAALAVESKNTAAAVQSIGEAGTQTAAEIKAYQDAMDAAGVAADNLAAEGAAKFQELQDEITMANLTGTALRLAQIDAAHQAELDSLAEHFDVESQMYEEMVLLIGEKYTLMSEAAQGHFSTVQQAADAAGFKTREELELTAQTANETYNRMKESGLFTYKELQKAHAAAKKAEAELDAISGKTKIEQFNLIASAASSILKSAFGHTKGAAIASAIVDTAAAVVSSFKNAGGWPWGLIPAAAMAAAGLAEISKIRGTSDGFATGTPGTRFEDFGRGSVVTLHGNEAVVTPAQGESVAGMVTDALERALGSESATAVEMRGLRDDIVTMFHALPIMTRDAQLQRV